MKAAGETPKLTLTFTVPISQFTGKDLNSIEAYHFDGTKLEKWSSKPAVSENFWRARVIPNAAIPSR